MKIRHKITLGTTALFGVVFLLVASLIYISFYKGSKRIFYEELARTAKIAGMFYLEEDELTKAQFKPIEDAFYNLNPEQEISIYDEKDSIAFDTKSQSLDLAEKLEETRRKGSLNFQEGDDFYHGLFYIDNQGDFVVLIKAQNSLMQSQLRYLVEILIIAILLGMGVLILLTSRFSKLAYRPIRQTIKQVNTLNLNQKPLRLNYKSTKDELQELVEAFNSLLREIEQNYEQQKNFVDYASHEMKTPLAGIISQMEIALQRKRSLKEHEEAEKVVLQEGLRLQGILKNLLTFSSLSRTAHQKSNLRIDELVWNVVEKLTKKYERSRFIVNLQIPPEKSELLEVQANKTLMRMALLNFMDNAAKFSKATSVKITLTEQKNRLLLRIEDRGMGISKEDLKHISQPFFRAANTTEVEGSGLGLSIAYKVMELHQVKIRIKSLLNQGTTIDLLF